MRDTGGICCARALESPCRFSPAAVLKRYGGGRSWVRLVSEARVSRFFKPSGHVRGTGYWILFDCACPMSFVIMGVTLDDSCHGLSKG